MILDSKVRRGAGKKAQESEAVLNYMTRMSPLLDVKLLFLSVWVTLSGKWQAEDKNLR